MRNCYPAFTAERVRELTRQYAPANPAPSPVKAPPGKVAHAPYRYVTTAERDRMVELWNSGKHLCDIAREVGRDQSVVRIALRKSNIDTAARPRKINAKANIIAELKAGTPVVVIAKKRHRTACEILRIARDAGIPASEIDTGKERAA